MALVGTINAPNDFGMKNRIINGAMAIDQRNAGASTTPGASFSYQLDRWSYGTSVASKISVQQVADAPAGFYNSVKLTSLSAYSITASNRFIFSQIIEGYNTVDLNWGTSDASPVTLSFWVKSSLTGTFACSFNNYDGSRSYVTTYTISSANTWEKKIITITGPTSGSFQTGTNGGSIYINFDLGTGSTYTTSTLNTWQNAFYENATGATALPATNGATWQLTGVQFEKGSTATSFDFRSFGTELSLCQRYFEKSFNHDVRPQNGADGTSFYANAGLFAGYISNTFPWGGSMNFKQTKRAQPTIGGYGNSSGYGYGGGWGPSAIAPSGIGWNGICWSQQNIGGSAVSAWHWTAEAEL